MSSSAKKNFFFKLLMRRSGCCLFCATATKIDGKPMCFCFRRRKSGLKNLFYRLCERVGTNSCWQILILIQLISNGSRGLKSSFNNFKEEFFGISHWTFIITEFYLSFSLKKTFPSQFTKLYLLILNEECARCKT